MTDPFLRIRMLWGDNALTRLNNSRVALFGLGGVGGYALEALVRSGIGSLLLVDNDRFHTSNLNRQILSTQDALGRLKTEVARERALSINPACRIEIRNCFFLPETRDAFDFTAFDYVIDAIDTVTGKLTIIEAAREAGVPVISCMGTGNKCDPGRLRVGDLFETSIDPLARIMRRECKKRGILSLKVVYSTEEPIKPRPESAALLAAEEAESGAPSRRRDTPGSTAFVPAAAGLLLAAEVVKDLLQSAV